VILHAWNARKGHWRTPYSTQHGVKGAEFDDVLVVVDDKAWNHYDMAGMIGGTEKNLTRLARSRNMFYVCCSRARRRLAVVFVSDLSPKALAIAREWFGPENIVE
jgi:DNA helicase-2/ATP-dependent DNA helicase PcrA